MQRMTPRCVVSILCASAALAAIVGASGARPAQSQVLINEPLPVPLARYRFRTITGSAGGSQDAAVAVVSDSQGYMLAAGRLHNAGAGMDLAVIKFNALGNVVWQRTLNGTANGWDAAN